MEEKSGGAGADSDKDEVAYLQADSEDCRSSDDGSSTSEEDDPSNSEMADIAQERKEDQPPVLLPKVQPRHQVADIKRSYIVAEDAPPECDYQLVERPPYTFPNGSSYKGQWCGSHPMGEGCRTFPDGRKYQGEFHNGKAHGTGSGLLGDGTKYVGPWVNDAPHGSNGFRVRHDGAFYLGEFFNGMEHGEGTLTMSDRSTFVGQFNSGFRDGKGLAVYKAIQQNKIVASIKKKVQGNCVTRKYVETGSYDGEFLKDNLHGDGVFQWVDGRRYEGQWEMNRMHGHGKYTFADGRKYQGQYKNGEKSGIGTYEWPDGRVYVGQVLRGAQHGRGVYTNTKGKNREGIWHLGRPAAALSSQRQQEDLDWI